MAAPVSHRFETLFVGDLAPWFRQLCIGQDHLFSFDMVAGRFVVLCFYGSARETQAQQALARLLAHRAMFDGQALAFFGVSCDSADEANADLAPAAGVRHFADKDGAISRAYGVAPRDGAMDLADLRRCWLVLDPRLRIIATFPLNDAGTASVFHFLGTLPTPALYGQGTNTPVLAIPGVFEPEFCARLVGLHQATGGTPSGMQTEGATVADPGFKRRRDVQLTDNAMIAQIQTRIFRRVVPEIRHVFQFNATRLERLILAVYDAAEAGRFGAHRDNTVAATAHRRFAVSINLNDDFDGGSLVFPEYSRQEFRPSLGGALVFSCSLLHAVTPMTRGRRYACLPFVYDDDAAAKRRTHAAPTYFNSAV